MKILDKILAVMTDREGETFSSTEIKNMVLRAYRGTNRESVIPSDYCYNMTNKGIKFSKRDRLFEEIDGRYKYLGLGYQYVGKIFWKKEPVGEWKTGDKDPHFWKYISK